MKTAISSIRRPTLCDVTRGPREEVKRPVLRAAPVDGFETSTPSKGPKLTAPPLFQTIGADPGGQLQPPPFPGKNATEAQLARFLLDLANYQASLPPSPAAQTGIPSPRFPGLNATADQKRQYSSEIQKYLGALKEKGLAAAPGLVPPPFPGQDATAADLVQYASDVQRFVNALEPRGPSIGPAPIPIRPQAQATGSLEDRAAAALGALKEPEFPPEGASELELAKFQKDLARYNRMYELMSKVMANAHEMKKALIGNLPR